ASHVATAASISSTPTSTDELPGAWARSRRGPRRPATSTAATKIRSAMPKVTMIGAGSAVFARQVITDTPAIDGLDAGDVALVDIDAERLELARQIAERLVGLSGKRWTVTASTDRREVLHDTDYVVNSIEVAGLQNVRADYDIPLKYGAHQCIGDTNAPGGTCTPPPTGPPGLPHRDHRRRPPAK